MRRLASLSSITKQLDSTFCSSPLETRSKRFSRSSSSTFVNTMHLYIFKHASNLSIHYSRPVLCLYVLKFSSTLASRTALSVVPALSSSTFQPCSRYNVSLHAKAVVDVLEARKQYAKHASSTRREDTNSRYKGCTLHTSSP